MRPLLVAALVAGGVLQWTAVLGAVGTTYAWSGRLAAEPTCAASGPDGQQQPGDPQWSWAPPGWTCAAGER